MSAPTFQPPMDASAVYELTERDSFRRALVALGWSPPVESDDALMGRDLTRSALENCRLYAARHRDQVWAQTILRFCREGGANEEPLR